MTSTWQEPSARERLAILQDTRSVTILGASDKPSRASHTVSVYLLASSDYRLSFVNPRLDTLFDSPVYPSLADLSEPPDLVAVFRRHEELPAVAEQAVAAGACTLWFQLGLWHEEAARYAAGAGLRVVSDRCVKIEHARFADGLHRPASTPG